MTLIDSSSIQKANYKFFLLSLFWLFLLSVPASISAQTISAWLTKGDQSVLLQEQGAISFSEGTASGQNVIRLDDSVAFQSIDGLGFALTQGSAEVINSLNSSEKESLLNDLFDKNSGKAISMLRISIGASDLSNSVYTYNESDGDFDMSEFSLNGPDLTHVIPLLKDILQINPDIKIMATPWTAPTWMKSNDTWIGGTLKTSHYQAYADYFLKYLEAMDSEGINIWAITPQNEPEHPGNEPSMLMTSTEQINFINNHLGPTLANSTYSPKIIAFDHNCDNTAYPIDVLNNSNYVDGAAFHLYAGDISAMGTVQDQTGKNVYFTEQFTSSNGNFDQDFGWHLENVVIGSLRNQSKAVIEWNLATDSNFGPYTPGGCDQCLGAITINNQTNFTKNVSYYIISQLSKFVTPGAQRIASVQNNTVVNVALKNTDGSISVLAYNKSNATETIQINWKGKTASYELSGRSAITLSWDGMDSPNNPSEIDAFSIIQAENFNQSFGIQLEDCLDTGGGQNVGFTDTGDYLKFDNVNFGAGATGVQARIASDSNFNGSIEFRLDSQTGTLLGTINTANTGGWQTWQTNTASLTTVSGIQNIVLIFKGGNGIANLNWFTFTKENGSGTINGIKSGSDYKIKNKGSGKSMQVTNSSQANGARIQQSDFEGQNHEIWLIDETKPGEFRLTVKHSAKVLDLLDSSLEDGAEIQQWDDFESPNQRWLIQPNGDGFFKIKSSLSKKPLAVPVGNTTSGTRLIQTEESNASDWQLWDFELADNQALHTEGFNNDSELIIVENPIKDNCILIKSQTVSTVPNYCRLYDFDGSLVFEKELITFPSKVDLPENIADGLYYLIVSTSNGKLNKKLVLNRN